MTKTRIVMMVAFGILAITLYAESLNEVTPLEREQLGIHFKIGNFQSHNRMNFYRFWYIGKMRKHQDFEGCVVADSDNNMVANWAIMTSQVAIEVCLYQIARHFKDIEELRAFLEATRSIRTTYHVSDTRNTQFVGVDCKRQVDPCAFPSLGLLLPTRESATIRYIDNKFIYVDVNLDTK